MVLLGDLLELREAPAAAVLDAAEPFLRALGEACAGKPVVIVPGNHDHELVAPALDDARLRSARAAAPSRPSSTPPPGPWPARWRT